MSAVSISQGPEERGYIVLKTHQLIRADWNYKEEDEELQNLLKSNLQRNGQVQNLIVRALPSGDTTKDGLPIYEVPDGNHRLPSLKKLGQEEVMCYNLGRVSEAEAKRIALEVNETQWDADPIALAETMSDVEAEFGRGDILDTMPFTDDEMDHFEDMLEWDWEDFEDEVDEEGAEGDGDDQDPDHWETLEFLLTEQQMNVFEEAVDRVVAQLQEEGYDLPDDPPVRRGQVLELLAASHLTGPPIDPEVAETDLHEDPPF